jgi:hypothetical protein
MKKKFLIWCIKKMTSELFELDDAEIEGKPFRIAGKRLHLTYKSHIDIADLLNFIVKATGIAIVWWSGCWEIGGTGYDHTHLGVEFVAKLDVKNSRLFDFNDAHPNIKKIATKEHWDNILKYHQKDAKKFFTNRNPEKSKPKLKNKTKADDATVEDIQKFDNPGQAVRELNDPKQIGAIELSFRYKEKDYGPEPEKVWWLPWQADLLKELKGSPDDRRFIWYYDQIGDSGKSIFAEHLEVYWKNALILTSVNTRDTATILQSISNKGTNIEVVIVDLTRSQLKEIQKDELYKGLEMFKNGVVTAQKYIGGTIVLKPMHVVVFSNSPPFRQLPKTEYIVGDDGTIQGKKKVMVDTVSADRWDIRTLGSITHPDYEGETVGVVNRYLGERKYQHKVPEGFVKPGLPRKQV